MRSTLLRATAAVLAAVVLVGCSGAGRLRAEMPDAVETQATQLYRLGEAASAVYVTDPLVTKVDGGFTPEFGWTTEVVDLPVSSGRAFVLTNIAEKRQIIVFRGTANAANVAVDFSYSKVWNEVLKCHLHNGFHASAVEAWHALESKIVKGFRLTVTGHSLGGAIAVIFGMGALAYAYDVEAVVTFGQPKVTNQDGAERWDADMLLPLTRVVHGADSVAVLPMMKPSDVWQHGPFWHFGVAIIIDDAGKFEILTSAAARTSGSDDYWEQLILGDRIPLSGLLSHPMNKYLEALWRWVPHRDRLVPVEAAAEVAE